MSPAIHADLSTFEAALGGPGGVDPIDRPEFHVESAVSDSLARVQHLTDHTARIAARLTITEQLAREACDSANRRHLIFHMLNRTVALCTYDRASAWSLAGRRPKLLGISGQARVDPQSPAGAGWAELLGSRNDLHEPVHLNEASWDQPQLGKWRALAESTRGLDALWIPLGQPGRPDAALCFERWGEAQWDAFEIQALDNLARWYELAWSKSQGICRGLGRWLARWKTVTGLVLLVGLVGVAVGVRLPLRIVAPCRVVPVEPLAVTAPLDGVIERVVVEPGRQVAAGEVLARYDSRAIRERHTVAAQQVRVVEAELQRARVGGFDNPTDRAEIALLENRLAQERARLALADYQLSQATITAPHAGQVAIDNPADWRGRPVMTGQRLMMLIDPQQTKLRIDLPVDDRIDFDQGRPVRIMLHAQPDQTLKASLNYVAPHSRVNDRGLASFLAEATWAPDASLTARVGLSGTAVLYGEPVCLAYWLGRKPLAWLRTNLGW